MEVSKLFQFPDIECLIEEEATTPKFNPYTTGCYPLYVDPRNKWSLYCILAPEEDRPKITKHMIKRLHRRNLFPDLTKELHQKIIKTCVIGLGKGVKPFTVKKLTNQKAPTLGDSPFHKSEIAAEVIRNTRRREYLVSAHEFYNQINKIKNSPIASCINVYRKGVFYEEILKYIGGLDYGF